MKTKTLSLLVSVLMAMIAFVGCEKEHEPEQEPEEIAESHNTIVTYSECKAHKGFNDIVTSVRYENGTLYFTHTDVEFNCAINDVSVVPEVNGQTINIAMNEVCGELVADCLCPIDVNYSIDNIKAGTYTIVVKVADYTIYQAEMDCQ